MKGSSVLESKSNIVAIKLTSDSRKALISGDWIEASHSFKSSGTYNGDFQITDQMIMDFDKNFKAGVVRRWKDEAGKCRLILNFEHWQSDFAGWITDTQVREKMLTTGEKVKSLWIKCSYTPDAKEANTLEGKEYISIEYYHSEPLYLDDQTGQQTANVLVGGALTSSPFCMELAPFRLSTLIEKHKELADQQKKKDDIKNPKKEELSKMKIIVATLGNMGIKLSSEPSEDAVVDAIKTLSAQRDEAKTELSTVKAEIVTVKKELSDKVTELKKIQDAQKAALSAARSAKIAELKEKAVTDVKLSKAEVDEIDPAQQVLFIKMLSLEDLSLAETMLSTLPKKVDVKGIPGSAPEGLSADEALVAQAKALQADAVKAGKTLSSADALIQAKTLAAKGGK
jgi:hypothetical protein